MRIVTTVGECTLRKIGKIWYARIQRAKHRKEIHLGTGDEAEAIERAQELVPNYIRGIPEIDITGTGTPDRAYYALMLRNARGRAKQRGLAFTITDEDWKSIVLRAGGRCELTGVVFSLAKGKNRYRAPFAPSLDRINCEVGYIASNVRLVCVAMNYALSDWGQSVFETIALAYVGKRMVSLLGDHAEMKTALS